MNFQRDFVSIECLPGTDAFTVRYLNGDSEVHRLFEGAPWDEATVQRHLSQVMRRETPHREVADALLTIYPEGENPRIRAQIELIRGGAPVIISGQQPGLFGGPAYTLYKFLTTRALADYWSERLGLEIVPAFWIGSEDSDLREMGWAALPDRSGGIWEDRLTLKDEDTKTPAYVYSVHPEDRARLCAGVSALLPNARLCAEICDAYSEGTLFEGFWRLYRLWAENLGIVLIPSHLPSLRRLALPVYAREVETAGTSSRLVNEAGARLRHYRVKPPIHKFPDHLNFYWLMDHQRQFVRRVNSYLAVGTEKWTRADFLKVMETDPSRIASGVVLRPIIQDYLFRTLILVGGPSEIVYLPQLRAAYDHFGVPFPLISPRWSATIITGKYARLMEKFGLSAPDIFRTEGEMWQIAATENRVAKTIRKWEQAEGNLRDLLSEIQKAAIGISPALARDINAWAQSFIRQNYVFRSALKKELRQKESDLREDIHRLCQFVRPYGKPQERVFSGIYFYAIAGEALLNTLRGCSPDDLRRHWVLTAAKE